jgi:GntR family transcriptional regulator, transcriptional repressor for pyruvate dehydrogenase complex
MLAHADTPPAARETAGPAAVAGILAYLQARRLQPGDRLPSERDLAERLNVGRNAVREALATLVTLRMVESRPNSGIYLRRIETDSSFEALVMLTDLGGVPSAAEIAETMEVRAHLETQAVTLACERRTEEDLVRLARIVDHTAQVLEAGGNAAQADTDFHLAVVQATRNSVLVRMLGAFYRFTARRREALFFRDLAQARASLGEHRVLAGHIRARDASAARKLILRHMARASHYWDSVLNPPSTVSRTKHD